MLPTGVEDVTATDAQEECSDAVLSMQPLPVPIRRKPTNKQPTCSDQTPSSSPRATSTAGDAEQGQRQLSWSLTCSVKVRLLPLSS